MGSSVGAPVGFVGIDEVSAVGLVGNTVGLLDGPDGVQVGEMCRALLCGGIGEICPMPTEGRGLGPPAADGRVVGNFEEDSTAVGDRDFDGLVVAGFFVGRMVGRAEVGAAVKQLLGTPEGAAVGSSVGLADLDGRKVGLTDGTALVGRLVGRRVGRLVGFIVATAVGSSVGAVVGSSVGNAGLRDGRRVKVGSSVGSVVGSSVGFTVVGVNEIVGLHVPVGVRVGKSVLTKRGGSWLL